MANCSASTIDTYTRNLQRFATAAPPLLAAITPLLVQQYLTGLRDGMKPITVHQHFRCLKTFFTWCVEVELLHEHPMRGLIMQLPKTLPVVPEDDYVRRLLGACPDTFEGRRNRALVALLEDSGLRISEALRLRVEDVNFATRTIAVRGGKGGKDGVGFFGSEAAQCLRSWLAKRTAQPEDYLFVDRSGRSVRRDHATHIFHRLSVRAGLPRKVGPHALRHYAATSILKQTGVGEEEREPMTSRLRFGKQRGGQR